MLERTQSNITIWREERAVPVMGGGGTLIAAPVCSVPITEQSVVNYMLMQQHYVQLDFTLAQPVEFKIGDYINDELFGRFYISAEQMPQRDAATGGWHYQLQFVAWYWLWEQKNCMQTTILTSTGNRRRKATEWYLTNTITEQVLEVLHNLQVLGYCDKSYTDEQLLATYADIQQQHIADFTAIKLMSYNGVKICSALSAICQQWECEWWVTGTREAWVLHIGKCEDAGSDITTISEVDWIEDNGAHYDANVQSMQVQKNSDDYANMFYIYGSKDNIPYTYRKQVKARCVYNSGIYYTLQVPNIVTGDKGFFDPRLFNGAEAQGNVQIASPAGMLQLQQSGDIYAEGIVEDGYALEQVYSMQQFPLATYAPAAGSAPTFAIGFSREISGVVGEIVTIEYGIAIKRYNSSGKAEITELCRGEETFEVKPSETLSQAIRTHFSGNLCTWQTQHNMLQGEQPIMVYAVIAFNINNGTDIRELQNSISMTCGNVPAITMRAYDISSATMQLLLNGHRYTAKINPQGAEKPAVKDKTSQYYQIAFLNASGAPVAFNSVAQGGDTIQVEQGTQKGTEFIVDDNGIIDIPLLYYTQVYENPSALSRIADARLQLPENDNASDARYYDNADNPKWVCINGCIVPYKYRNDLESDKLIEAAVAFDSVYPNGKLQVAEVIAEQKHEQMQGNDGTEKYNWDWLQYHVKLRHADAAYGAFTFDAAYVLEGYELALRFLSAADLNGITPAVPVDMADGCRLQGMQFAAQYSKQKSITPSGEDVEQQVAQVFSLARNEDYGTKLPNELIYPHVGDPCCLINWNVRAMAALGLISSAEHALMRKGFEWAQAVEEAQFTFTATMSPQFLFSLGGDAALYDSDDAALYDSNGMRLYVRSFNSSSGVDISSVYRLPAAGMRIKIRTGAVTGGEKISRVIGYEMKLDKPYDHPQLTIGETEAYSRIKQLERQLTQTR